MTTTKKKRTTKPRTKKVEAVVDHDGHDVVEEVVEPEAPSVPHLHTIKIYKRSATGKPVVVVGYASYSEKREQTFATPPTNDDLVRLVSSGYMIKGIHYIAHTKEWILNLPNAALPDLMYADAESYTVGVEE